MTSPCNSRDLIFQHIEVFHIMSLIPRLLSLAVSYEVVRPVLVLHVVVGGGEAGLERRVVVSQFVLQLLLPLALHQLVEVEGGPGVLHRAVTSPPELGRDTRTELDGVSMSNTTTQTALRY